MSMIEKALQKAKGKGKLGSESRTSQNKSKNNVDARKKNQPILDSFKKETDSIVIPINIENLSKHMLVSSNESNVQLSEEYRIIKRPILNNAFGALNSQIKHANLVLVTSSQPGEGKTFTAVNLAFSIASERDKKVLLVDADVTKPSVSKILGIQEDTHGLIDYLDGEDLDFSMMMLKTEIPGLTIIPAGKKHGYATELLASNRMSMLAEELHSRYSDRIVIFDSPPLLAATQAQVLAGLVGQVILVVEAEMTLHTTVTESLNKLKECDVVLALMNKAVDGMGMDQYGYGKYGY